MIIRLPDLREVERPINDWSDPLRLEASQHIHQLLSRPDNYASQNTVLLQRHKRCVRALHVFACAEGVGIGDVADAVDETVEADGVERRLERERATDFDDVVHALPLGDFLRPGSPVRLGAVVDGMRRTELLGLRQLLVRGRSDDGIGASRMGDLEAKGGNTASTLQHDRLTWPQRNEAVQCVPCCQCGARQTRSLLEGKVVQYLDNAQPGEDVILAK